MKLAYANYHDGIETRIFVKEEEEATLVKDWEDHGVSYEFFPRIRRKHSGAVGGMS